MDAAENETQPGADRTADEIHQRVIGGVARDCGDVVCDDDRVYFGAADDARGVHALRARASCRE